MKPCLSLKYFSSFLKKPTAVLFAFFSFATAAAQSDSSGNFREPYIEAEVSGDYFFNSNALTTEFVNTFYTGGFITPEIKGRVDKNLKYSNRFGADANYGFSFHCKPESFFGKKNISWSASAKDRLHVDGVFSRDLFRVSFYGNKMFAGQIADLGNSRVNILRFQQLQFGLTFEGDSTHGDYGFSFSLLKGEKNISVDIDRANLTTSADGTKIDFDLAMNIHQTDTGNTGGSAFNGMGASFDLFYEIPYVTWYNDGIFRLDIFDLGFIRWNNRSMYLYKDSLYSYTGVEINNIYDLQNQTIPSSSADSIVNKNASFSRMPYTTFLPSVFSVSATTFYGKKFIFEKGMSYRFNANCRPYYYGTFSWFFVPQAMISAIVAYGGYGNFNAGAEFEAKILKRYILHIDSYYLLGYLLPQKFCGQGFTVSFSGRF